MTTVDPDRDVVLATIRESLKHESFRQWRIARYGREVITDWGDVYTIDEDGSLVLTHQEVR